MTILIVINMAMAVDSVVFSQRRNVCHVNLLFLISKPPGTENREATIKNYNNEHQRILLEDFTHDLEIRALSYRDRESGTACCRF